MIRIIAFMLPLGIVIPSVFADATYEELFNGRDLTGWDADSKFWFVEDGVLTGKTSDKAPLTENTFAIWTGGEVDNFELRVVFRIEGHNNSGVQYRSQRVPGRTWGVVGYQADLHPALSYAGMLYDEEGRKIIAKSGSRVRLARDGSRELEHFPDGPSALDFSKWNELHIRAVGNYLVHRLNGKVTAEVVDDDPKHADVKGLLALQLHAGPAMKVQFKSIGLRRIGSAETVKEKRESDDQPDFGERATSPDRIKMAEGFKIDLLYTVPRSRMGSWVNLCVDPQGRLITSDEYGDLYRIALPRNEPSTGIEIERINVDIGQAQGLLYAFDSLFVVVNGDPNKRDNGLHRVWDSDGDDQFDSYELLRNLEGVDDHGPHAVLMGPDNKSLYVVCGNNTKMTEFAHSRVPRLWDEDQLLPRLYGVGYMRTFAAPGGCIYRTDPSGKEWELVGIGFRNTYDAAFKADGELFTYDSDMEFDFGTPWYRPTRVCHVVSGSDWGWRNGSAKWPVYYPETLPPVINIGPGSPTGVTFGYRAKFPAKYQEALFLCDWTYGKIYALHLEPRGASFGGTLEELVAATPLPLTDIVVNRHDGAMYAITGGRGVQTGLYRISYVGGESITPISPASDRRNDQRIRQELEAVHLGPAAESVDMAWPHLDSDDRFIRHAARVVLEQSAPTVWEQRALNETDPQAALTSILALIRTIPRTLQTTRTNLDTPPPAYPATDAERHPLQPQVFAALSRLARNNLKDEQRIELLRLYALAFYRMGAPDESSRASISAEIEELLPASCREINVMGLELLCYLQSPNAATVGIELLGKAPTQEEQLDYARSLRFVKTGWTNRTRRAFVDWIVRAQGYKGGQNFETIIGEIRAEALAGLSQDERAAVKDLVDKPTLDPKSTITSQRRLFVKEWTRKELLPLLDTQLKGRNFERGREMFAAANCFACHRFNDEGGAVGPDLTALSGRFSAQDILESILEPSKIVSDQYAAVVVTTVDGKQITGRVVNYNDGEIFINTNMLDPLAIETCNQSSIEELTKSEVSMMPQGLLNSLTEDEILDLFAYLLSRGDRNHPAFATAEASNYSAASPAN